MEEVEVPHPTVKLSMNPGHHDPPPTSSALVPRVEDDDGRELPGCRSPWGLYPHLQVDLLIPNTFYMF